MAVLVDDVEKAVQRVQAIAEGWGARVHPVQSLRSGPPAIDLDVGSSQELEAALAAVRPAYIFHERLFEDTGYEAGNGPLVVELTEPRPSRERPVAACLGWLHDGALLRALVGDRERWPHVAGTVVAQLLDHGKPDACFDEVLESLSPTAYATMLVDWIHQQSYSPRQMSRQPEQLVDAAIEAHGPVPALLEADLTRKLKECRRLAIKMMRGEARMGA